LALHIFEEGNLKEGYTLVIVKKRERRFSKDKTKAALMHKMGKTDAALSV
jgi:hypothetical protein